MIVTTSFLALSLIIGFIFLGIKMSESIQHGDIKVFFFALYTITLITLINIVISLEDFHEIKNNIDFETPELSNLLEKNREDLNTGVNLTINYNNDSFTLNYSNQC